MEQQLSRQELHELVWSEPRTALSKRLGVSDTGLANACVRAGIPMPERGYWARLAAGRPAAKVLLPQRGLGQSDLVRIGKPVYRPVAEDGGVEVPPEPYFPESVDVLRARADALLMRCRVPKGLQLPHRLIAGLIEEDEARRRANGGKGFSWEQPRFDSKQGQRRMRIVNALFIVMTHAGCQASVSSRELDKIGFRIGDTSIGVEIATCQRKSVDGRGRTLQDDRFSLTAPWPRLSGVPTSWSDDGSGSIEDRITLIARDLLVMGELAYREGVRHQYEWCLARRQEHEARIRAERERSEREERERRLQEEKERLEWLLGQSANLRHASGIRALVLATDARFCGSPEALAAAVYANWRSWALAQADLLDPCLGSLAALGGPAAAGELFGPVEGAISGDGQSPNVTDLFASRS